MKLYKLIILSAFFLLSSCKDFSFCDEKVPYLIKAELDMGESTEFDIAGLNLYFLNRSEKQVSEITIVFYMFDEDGEPASLCRSNIVLSVKENVAAGTSIETCLNLDSFFTYIPEEQYTADYIYVSRIVYEDGSEWKDSFGLQLY